MFKMPLPGRSPDFKSEKVPSLQKVLQNELEVQLVTALQADSRNLQCFGIILQKVFLKAPAFVNRS